MNWKDIILCGLQDLKSQRRKNRISFLMIFLSLVSYIGVNSTIDGIDKGMYNSVEGHYNRLLHIWAGDETWLEKYQYICNKYGEDERVDEIVVGAMDFYQLEWTNVQEMFGVDRVRVELCTFYDALLTSNYKGDRRMPENDEIILPRYIYNEGIYDEYTCYNCDELIGETITYVMNPFDTGERVYEFKVIGTYDNISKVTMYHSFLNSEVVKGMMDTYYDARNKWIDELIEEYGSVGNTKRKGYEIYMVIKDGYDIDVVCEDIFTEVFEETNESVLVSKQLEMSEEVVGYYDYIKVIGNIVAFLFLVVAIINIIISAVSEVKQRGWEFSLKMAMGYTKKDIIRIFSVEKLANAVKALILSVAVLLIYSKVLTYYYQNMEVYWKRSCMITINPLDVVIATILVTLASFMGIITARFLISNINISKSLKKGE